MLSDLCQELRNWFNYNQPKLFGAFEIKEGKIAENDFLDIIKENQYFRIVGSTFNDGVYKYTNDLELIDEVFVGAIWLMAVPKQVIDLNNEIDEWISKYKDTVQSPFSNESFGGYSYSKASGGSSGSSGPTWQSIFANRLNMWRKI